MAGLSQRLRRPEPEPESASRGKPRVARAGTTGGIPKPPCSDDTPPTKATKKLARLVRTIEGEIIPRLMLAHRSELAPRPVQPVSHREVSSEEIDEFTALVLVHDTAVACAYVQALRAQGLSLDTVCLDLLSPAARRLGAMWEADLCDFTQVTVGLWRLQQVLRELNVGSHLHLISRPPERRCLIATAPGEQHLFGVQIVSEFLRRADWEVHEEYGSSKQQLSQRVRDEWFAVVGLSASCDISIESVGAAIRAIRKASKNRSVGIMVGGTLFSTNPDNVSRVGADATAIDGRQAVAQARQLSSMMAKRS